MVTQRTVNASPKGICQFESDRHSQVEDLGSNPGAGANSKRVQFFPV